MNAQHLVRSSEPMERFGSDARSFPVDSPKREIEVPLLASETDAIEIEATTVDGRVTMRVLAPNAGSLTLEFAAADAGAVVLPAASAEPAPKKTTVPRSTRKPKPSVSTPAAPGLAPTPFGK